MLFHVGSIAYNQLFNYQRWTKTKSIVFFILYKLCLCQVAAFNLPGNCLRLYLESSKCYLHRECVCVRERWLKGAFVHFSVWSLWPLTSCLFVKWPSKHWPHTRSHLLYVEHTVCWPSSRFIFKQNRPRSRTSLVKDLKTNWILLKTIIFLSVQKKQNCFSSTSDNICCPIWAWPNQTGPVPFIMCLSQTHAQCLVAPQRPVPVIKLDTSRGSTSICSILISSSPGKEKYFTCR